MYNRLGDQMTHGVIYYNRGRKCCTRMLVSMMTMRRHYKGPITLFLDDCGFGKENMDRLTEDVKKELDVDVIRDENPDTTTYVRAVEVSLKSPYDLSIWMDADTIILGKFDELFDEAAKHDFVIPHFAGWSSKGSAIGGRIRNLTPVCPQYIQAALDYGPAINCGVYAWPKGSPFLPEWLTISKGAEATGTFIPDEKSCQVLLPQYNVKIMPTNLNVSVIHDPAVRTMRPGQTVHDIARQNDWRIIHFHGRKHVRQYPVCDLWIEEFMRALRDDVCHIRGYIGREFGDRQLSCFLAGGAGRPEEVAIIKSILASPRGTYDLSKHQPLVKPCGNKQLEQDMEKIKAEIETGLEKDDADEQPVQDPPKGIEVTLDEPPPSVDERPLDPDKVTVVTACDPKYVEMLAITFPTWVSMKKILRHKMIVFVNGMPLDDKRLDFLRHPNVRLIPWSMPNATSHREEMLSAFILGAAKHVTTPYWLKLDADSYATDDRPLLVNWMTTVTFCGHRWGYSWTEHIKALDKWAIEHPGLVESPLWGKPMYDKTCDKGRKYFHPSKRTISFAQLQETAFTKTIAALAGSRLPVPSHDTYMYYMADRMGLPWRSSNFKGRRGFTQGKGVDGLKEEIGKLGIKS
jgi:hypothetical protein